MKKRVKYVLDVPRSFFESCLKTASPAAKKTIREILKQNPISPLPNIRKVIPEIRRRKAWAIVTERGRLVSSFHKDKIRVIEWARIATGIDVVVPCVVSFEWPPKGSKERAERKAPK